MTENRVFEKYGKKFKEGEIIFNEGEPAREMFIIKKGKVKIFKKIGDIEKTLAILSDGEFFGEMALIENKPRSASALALTDCELISITGDMLDTMMKRNPEIGIKMVKKLSERLRETNTQIETLIIKDKEMKIVYTLLKECDEKGEPIVGGIKIPVTIEKLASLTEIPHEEIEEIITRLSKKEIVTKGEGYFVTKDRKILQNYFEYLTLKKEFEG